MILFLFLEAQNVKYFLPKRRRGRKIIRRVKRKEKERKK